MQLQTGSNPAVMTFERERAGAASDVDDEVGFAVRGPDDEGCQFVPPEELALRKRLTGDEHGERNADGGGDRFGDLEIVGVSVVERDHDARFLVGRSLFESSSESSQRGDRI